MLKKLKLTKLKIFIALLVIVAAIFGVYNIMWLNHVKKFDAFLNSERMQDIMALPAEIVTVEGVDYEQYRYRRRDSGGWKVHLLDDFNDDTSGYAYTIAIPKYLDFGGNISILTPTNADYNQEGELVYLSECLIDLTIFPRDWTYILTISDLTTVEKVGDGAEHLGSAVDKNGKPLGKHPDDSDEIYQIWLGLYEKFEDEIVEMFQIVHSSEYFGDILR